MALREGLPSNMLYANGASTMRNFVVVMAWHGGSLKGSTSCTDTRGSTLSSENPLKWAFAGSSFSLPIPILSNADAKMILVELLLSIKTSWTVLLAMTALITSGSSWGCWQPSRSASEKVMVVSNRGSLDMAYTFSVSPDLKLRKWAFLAELDFPTAGEPPGNHIDLSQRLLMLSRG